MNEVTLHRITVAAVVVMLLSLPPVKPKKVVVPACPEGWYEIQWITQPAPAFNCVPPFPRENHEQK